MRQLRLFKKTCAYTNHTILAEALGKMAYFSSLQEVVPQLSAYYMRCLTIKYAAALMMRAWFIIDKNDTVHMAHIDIHYGFSVNGVAALHTEILERIRT